MNYNDNYYGTGGYPYPNTTPQYVEDDPLKDIIDTACASLLGTNEQANVAQQVQINDNCYLPVEDHKTLEKSILDLVSNIPSQNTVPNGQNRTFTLVPPNKDEIISTIEKSYKMVNNIFKASPHPVTIVREQVDQPPPGYNISISANPTNSIEDSQYSIHITELQLHSAKEASDGKLYNLNMTPTDPTKIIPEAKYILNGCPECYNLALQAWHPMWRSSSFPDLLAGQDIEQLIRNM